MYEYSLMRDKTTKRPYMVEEKKVDYPNVTKMDDPDQIVRMMLAVYKMDDLAEESVYMLTMNAKCDVTGVFMIGKGDTTTCICSVRDMMTRALLAGATGFILVHNHPTGDPTPSDIDMQLTKRAATVGALLQVQMLDSLIVGNGIYVSMQREYPDTIKPMKVPNEWIS